MDAEERGVIVCDTDKEVVITRTTLVYAANVSTNFARLLRAAKMGVELLFALLRTPKNFILLESLVGRRSMWQQLCGSLQVDISKATTLLAWKPTMSVQYALRAAARNYSAEW